MRWVVPAGVAPEAGIRWHHCPMQRLARERRSNGGRAARAARALGLVAAVVLLHGWLLGGAPAPWSDPVAPSATAPLRSATAVQVRRLSPDGAPAPAPGPAAKPPAPPREPLASATRTPPGDASETAGTGAVPSVRSRNGQPVAAREPRAVAPLVPSRSSPAPQRSAPGLGAPPDPDVGDGAHGPDPIDAAPAPVYATRIPAPARRRYVIARGAQRGDGQLDWRVGEAGRYELQWSATLPSGTRVEQRSQGGFDAAGLAPERLSDRRTRRGTHSAQFDRAAGRIRFSGPRWEYPLPVGVQDRLSWIAQLAAIAGAGAARPGGEVVLQVVGARGAWAHWRFAVDGLQTLESATGEHSRALRLVREPVHPYDWRVEVWLAPALGWWPLQLRQTQVPGGDTVEWWLVDDPTPQTGS